MNEQSTRSFGNSRLTDNLPVYCIATGYGLDGPGSESWWGANIPYPSRPALGTHLASYTMGPGSYLGVKWPGRGVNRPLPCNAEVNERLVGYRVSFTSPPPRLD